MARHINVIWSFDQLIAVTEHGDRLTFRPSLFTCAGCFFLGADGCMAKRGRCCGDSRDDRKTGVWIKEA